MIFERDYFVGHVISAYDDYRTKDYKKLSIELMNFLNLGLNHKILDYGCATGNLVKCFFDLGIDIIGTDISYWAIEYGRENFALGPNILQHYNRQLLEYPWDYLISLDVFEHISRDELDITMQLINAKYMVLRIPVSAREGEDFVGELHRVDCTHVSCHPKVWWRNLLAGHGYSEQVYTFHGKLIWDSDETMCGVFKKDEI